MKHIFSIAFFTVTSLWQAQVIIGDDKGTAVDKTSVLLEFANTNNKGIVLPYVRNLSAASTANQGAIILDASNPLAAKVRYSDGTSWIDLGKGDGVVTSAMDQQPQTNSETAPDSGKIIIGNPSTTAEGVLVLESTNKAMVLPIVTNYLNIKNPAPGMMALLDSSVDGDSASVRASKLRLIVFNGSKWSFWKP